LLNGWYFAHTGFRFLEWHYHSHCYLSLKGICSVSVMMVAGEHLMMYHHLTADLMLIQELHGSHNSDIWNYPCNNKHSINIPLLYPTTCLNIKIRNLRMKRTQSFNEIRDVTPNIHNCYQRPVLFTFFTPKQKI